MEKVFGKVDEWIGGGRGLQDCGSHFFSAQRQHTKYLQYFGSHGGEGNEGNEGRKAFPLQILYASHFHKILGKKCKVRNTVTPAQLAPKDSQS